MADRDWQAGGKSLIPAQAVVGLFATVVPLTAAWALSDRFTPTSYVGSADPRLVWEVLIGGVVGCSFLAAVALWIHSALRKFKRTQLRRNAFVSSALNNLSQGVVMTDPGLQLLELRRKRGVLDVGVEDFQKFADSPEGLITELPNGRSILVRRFMLPNGGT